MTDTDKKCVLCGSALDERSALYPNAVCRDCDRRAVNAAGLEPETMTSHDTGDNPVFIDGVRCWRRYRFGSWWTMRDDWDCATLEEFYERLPLRSTGPSGSG